MQLQNAARLFKLEYPITKPFPHALAIGYVLVTGAVILGTLFGFVAVATNAYVVQSYYTSDPNGTEANLTWFQREPFSWFGSLKTTCQESMLSPAQTLMTTNQGFLYTLDSIWYDEGGILHHVPQVSYRNSLLHNCSLVWIDYRLLRGLQHDNKGILWTWGESIASAIVQCGIDDATYGTLQANFSVTLPRVSIQNTPTGFATQENNGLKSMWYGIQIAMEWYRQVASTMVYSISQDDSNDTIPIAEIKLYRNTSVTDWRSLDYLSVFWSFPMESGWIVQGGDITLGDWKTNMSDLTLPDIYESLDAFGKSFYSLLALDFGITNDSNVLTSQDGMQYLLNYNNTAADVGLAKCQSVDDEVPADYCATGQINTIAIDKSIDLSPMPPARLVTQYLCSVPRQKSQVSIAYSVTLAIIVFVSSLWSLSTLILRYTLVNGRSRANECVGCAAARADIELGHKYNSSISSSFFADKKHSPGISESESLLLEPRQPGIARGPN